MDDADQHSALSETGGERLVDFNNCAKAKRLHRHFLLGVVLCLAFTLAMVNVFGGNALAGSLSDVVTQVSMPISVRRSSVLEKNKLPAMVLTFMPASGSLEAADVSLAF